MRPRQFWIYVTIYISIVALLLFINYTIYEYQDVFDAREGFFKSLYAQFLLFEVIVLWIWAAYNSGTALKDEVSGKTYDFFRMLPLPAHQKAVGILVGRNLVALLLAAINCLFLASFGAMGKLSGVLQRQIFLVLISTTLLVNSLVLLCSINPVKGRKKANIGAFILLAFFAVPFFLHATAELSQIEELENTRATFFKMKLPILLLISFIALYFSCWTTKGILRRFSREQEPLFTRKGAFLFLLGYEFILFGLFYTHLPNAGTNINYSYWLISLLAVLAIPPTSLRSFDKYLEHSGLVREQRISSTNTILPMLSYSNLSLALGLFAIWAAASIGISFIAKIQLLRCLYPLFTLLSFYAFYILLLELYVVYNQPSGKIGLLLGFIGIVYLFFPLILSAILESEIIYLYSPLGFSWSLFEKPHQEVVLETSTQTSILVLNMLFCIIPALLVWKRYAHIATMRRKM
jgi:hypothetical protein